MNSERWQYHWGEVIVLGRYTLLSGSWVWTHLSMAAFCVSCSVPPPLGLSPLQPRSSGLSRQVFPPVAGCGKRMSHDAEGCLLCKCHLLLQGNVGKDGFLQGLNEAEKTPNQTTWPPGPGCGRHLGVSMEFTIQIPLSSLFLLRTLNPSSSHTPREHAEYF